MKKNKIAYDEVMENLSRVGIDYYSSADSEIEILKEAYEKCDDACLYPFVPMRLVALMEGYFQELYSNIIDADSKYRKNFVKLVKDVQFEPLIIDSFELNTITFGEYAAMLLPCNRLDDILTNISTLLDTDKLNDDLKDTSILADVRDVFFYRHIYCHEIAGNVRLEQSKILKMIDSASEFMKKTSDFVAGILYPNAPELTSDIINEAQKDFKAKDKELHELIKWLEDNINDELIHNDLDFMDIFDAYRKKRSRKVCKDFEDGTMYSFAYAQSMTDITDELICGLRKRYRLWLRNCNLTH